MQRNISFVKNKFSLFIFFCVLLFTFEVSLFANNSHIISPVKGEWSNFQSIIIDVPEGSTAFYSFTGDNPLYSGFAYESPVLLELEGNINLRIAILNNDNSVIEENVEFSVKKVPLEVPFYQEAQSQALISVVDKNISIPSYMRFSVGDNSIPYLKGRTITIDSRNSLEQILPLLIKNGQNNYRFMLKILNSSNDDINQNYVNKENLNEYSEDDYTIRRIEKQLSQCPFTLEFSDWTKLNITTAENIYVCLDDDVWQNGSFTLEFSRDISHTLSWIDLSGIDPEEFIPEQFKVYYSVIPQKPELNIIQDKSKFLEISLSDKNYEMELVQNQKGITSIDGRRKESYIVDTIYGNNLVSQIDVNIFYDGIFQGSITENFEIDKMPPKTPKIICSSENFFVREPVEIKFESEEKVYYVLKSKEISNLNLENLEIELSKNFAFDSSSAVEVIDDSLLLLDNKNAIFYNLAYFSKDDFGNVSEVEYYQVLIDSYNYYIDANSYNATYVPDGSPSRPFYSINQALPFLNKDKLVKIHIEGIFQNVSQLNFTSPCEIISKNGARLIFEKGEFISVEDSTLKISNCVLEQNFLDDDLFVQQNLFKLENANLVLDNCETVSLYEKNGSVIFANNSEINILNSGITIQTSIYSSVFNLLNSSLTCKQSRISTVSDSTVAFTMHSGKFNLYDSQIQVTGTTSKFYELFGVEYQIQNNVFLYKNLSKDMTKTDVFSKKNLYENNTINSF